MVIPVEFMIWGIEVILHLECIIGMHSTINTSFFFFVWRHESGSSHSPQNPSGMASLPCSIHSELSLASQRTRVAMSSLSEHFVSLKPTPSGLRGFSGGYDLAGKVQIRGIEARGALSFSALGGLSQVCRNSSSASLFLPL